MRTVLFCACVALALVFGLLSEVSRTTHTPGRGSSSPHESMTAELERARQNRVGVAMRDSVETRALAYGRDSLAKLAPGDELLVTAAQLLTILRLSVTGDTAPEHEKQLLKAAARMPDKAHTTRPSLSIVKTATEPPFIILLQAEGEHESFLLDHMRGAGGFAYQSNQHRPIGAVLDHALAGKCASSSVSSSASGGVAKWKTPSRGLMVDGGAYFGFFALRAASLGCHAVIIEPQQMLAPFLAASVLLNGREFAGRVQTLRAVLGGPAALAETGGKKVQLVDRAGMSSYAMVAPVHARTAPMPVGKYRSNLLLLAISVPSLTEFSW